MNVYQILTDLVMVAVAVLAICITVKRGFIKSFFAGTRMIIVVLVTILLGSSLTGFCRDLFVADMIDGKISSALVQRAEESGEQLDVDSMISSIPEPFSKLIPTDTVKEYFAQTEADGVEAAREVGKRMEDKLIDAISSIASYVAVFVITFLLCTVGVWVLDKIFKLPVLNSINKVLGFVLGTFDAYFYLSALACLAMLVLGADLVEGTLITRLIYKIGLFTR